MTETRTTLPVAEYLRMSTEHQQYSIENQRARIGAYAAERSFEVVRNYTDHARSGVVLKRREGLRRLLHDVTSGQREFKAILVYDVSRWGRFQDADEAAHYEFLCKSAGIPVHYCAEQFENDGLLQNALMKALKRTMAGEYSRELGVKVLAGLRRLAGLGFKQGGLPGYGLRRMLLSADGHPRQVLEFGERKSLVTERVTLVPGPAAEVAVVCEIYRLFLEDKLSVMAIARHLNRKRIPYAEGLPWTHHIIQQILWHPKYSGCNVFGRTSQKLGTRSIQVPESHWIRTPGAFFPIIDAETQLRAHKRLFSRTYHRSDTDILSALRDLLAKEGRLSLKLVRESDLTPSPSTYRLRFGSLRESYRLIGYGKPGDFGHVDLRRRTQAVREDLMRNIQAEFPGHVVITSKGGRWQSYLRLKSGQRISVLVAHWVGKPHLAIWQIDPLKRNLRRRTLIALLDPENSAVCEMRLFPNLHRYRRFTIRKDCPWWGTGRLLASVQEFYGAAVRV
jgi:DNA invertase Pin-like site-specific DNA recombinase